MSDSQKMETVSLSEYKYFLKGDVSGIQEFIFNVKSEGAARALKGRSFFIQVLSLIGIEMIKKEVAKDTEVKEFYNGGGDFYLLLKECDLAALGELQLRIDKVCQYQNFHLILSFISLEGKNLENDFGEVWNDLNEQSSFDKLTRFQESPDAFKPYYADSREDWKGFTKFLSKSEGYLIEEINKPDFIVDKLGVQIFGYSFVEGNLPYHNLVKSLPLWGGELIEHPRVGNYLAKERVKREGTDLSYLPPREGMIMEFSHLAGFAELRTGTNKLGILKLDADNLGSIFNYLPSFEVAQKISQDIISPFFGETIKELLQKEIASSEKDKGPKKFAENIYTVFSGGDDCFFVGAWDVILEWAGLVQAEFNSKVSEIAKPLIDSAFEKVREGMPREIEKINPPTLSGGVVFLEPTYPITRFADLTNSALDDAKTFTYTDDLGEEAEKNKVSLLNEVLVWEEFSKALELGRLLSDLIKEGEPRGTLEKIRSTAAEMKLLQDRARKGQRVGASISKLFYFIRKSKNSETIAAEVVQPFAIDLINAFSKRERSNPLTFPLAARLAEFYTRN